MLQIELALLRGLFARRELAVGHTARAVLFARACGRHEAAARLGLDVELDPVAEGLQAAEAGVGHAGVRVQFDDVQGGDRHGLADVGVVLGQELGRDV